MAIFALTISLVMSAVILWAGLEKARNLKSAASTMHGLGIPQRYSQWLAALLVLAEIVVAWGLLFRPSLWWTQISVGVLAVVFALAGFMALFQREPIRCNCFGTGGQGQLGWNQIVALLHWLAGVVVLYMGLQETLSLSAGAIRLSALGLSLATWRAIAVWRAQGEARGDRLSAMEMYLWER